jgi:hypothetical protein
MVSCGRLVTGLFRAPQAGDGRQPSCGLPSRPTFGEAAIVTFTETLSRWLALIGMKRWGYLALAVAAIGILVNLKDIRRYIRISTM